MPDSTTAVQPDADGRGPAPITIPPESPAAVEARDQLLAAIGAEAQFFTENFRGQVSTQLAELARAYTAVTSISAAFMDFEGNVVPPRFVPGVDPFPIPVGAGARDQLLVAIGTEAQFIAENLRGQASASLLELARSYTLVTTDTVAVAVPAVHARAGDVSHSISLVAHVPTNGFYVVPTDPDLVSKDQDGPITGR
ncbi:hypothetical protein ACI1MP_33170 [Kitasatospora griseola]|uniref:hypothetical protein n=1 Tax=Kitasatospora griseola TaxID=2064 RepID=UPI003855F88C